MEIKRYAEIVWHWLWLLVAGTVLAGAIAFVVSALQAPVYEASATLLVNQVPKSNLSDYSAVQVSSLLAQTYSQILTVRPVLEQVIVRLGLNLTADELQKAISVEVVRDTQLIKIRVEGTSPQAAAAVANTLPEVFREHNQALQTGRFSDSEKSLIDEIVGLDQQITHIQAQIQALGQPATTDEQAKLEQLTIELDRLNQSRTGLSQNYQYLILAEAQSLPDVIVVERADVPLIPVRPRTLVNTVLAALVGLMMALGVAFVVEYLDDTLKAPDQAAALLNLPVLGFIPVMERALAGKLYVRERLHTPTAEAFRSLRTNLEFAEADRPLRTILVTSAGAGEGKTTVSVNLALAIAQSGKKVVVLDADLRWSSVHRFFSVPNQDGLSDVLSDRKTLADVMHQSAESGLMVIPAGPPLANPAEMLGSKRMEHVLAGLQEIADVVVVDGPPSQVADAWVLSTKIDGVMLVVQAGHTTKKAAQAMVDQIRRGHARIVGLVFNRLAERSAVRVASRLEKAPKGNVRLA